MFVQTAASLEWTTTNWRNAKLVNLFDIAAISAVKSIESSMRKSATKERRKLSHTFCLAETMEEVLVVITMKSRFFCCCC